MLKGKTAIVTGGTAGIGQAIAQKFAQEGATVIILGTNPERGAKVAQEINGHFYAVDIADTAKVDECIKLILEKHPVIDILVNNAGITRDQLLLKMTEEDWDQVMDVNAKSCYNTCKALIRTLIKARKGKIINVSSVIGLIGNAGQMNYAASKGAVIALTKALAKEVASRNIQVNCLAPGFIETRMTNEMTDAQKQATLAGIPQGRMGKPEEIANAALFLASHLSDYVTGQVLTVDGGMVM